MTKTISAAKSSRDSSNLNIKKKLEHKKAQRSRLSFQ